MLVSEQRRLRKELRQGLHQFLMQLYTSFLENHNEIDAKQIVAEEIEECYRMFQPESASQKTAQNLLEEKAAELTKIMESYNDYDTQLFYAEKVDALNAAIEVLKE